ncbi:KpsF/GutQ family sugar-phosphate isomerase [Neolewinella aurantiaca]|uniref:KpsF/GutQ family sugar-phosphate isomerase n=1 Tax=Neolewinella aurantiaca TaxID=2602767 RepID=A0A5C7FW76_9BACT|nr:KpsF/GutQ family sugar-phosphate isomerase [Neolewinella aurantiaca]TXF89124.1 KpsF/GutQ family sugar-phosphate isomerase [Neolewinella aurantiaca]
MKNTSQIIRVARNTLQIEGQTLLSLVDTIGEDFVACVNKVYSSPGRLVVSGIGKTAIVAKKIVATLNSTGTPALFLHAADAIHGDIGMVRPEDLVMCLSKSGETAELKMLALLVRQSGNPLIAMVSREDCSLAQLADHILLTPVAREADPNDLAPTASTTAQMAMGDALATALLALRGFKPNDFARFHPGGSLGKQLYLRVSDLYVNNQVPAVNTDSPLREILLEMTGKRLGATAVLFPGSRLLAGVITDGDLRRMLNGNPDLEEVTAAEIMTTNPKTVDHDTLAIKALESLRTHNISQLVVTGRAGEYLGFLHLHDLIREGLV